MILPAAHIRRLFSVLWNMGTADRAATAMQQEAITVAAFGPKMTATVRLDVARSAGRSGRSASVMAPRTAKKSGILSSHGSACSHAPPWKTYPHRTR
jgi:hypothetical protein